MNIFHHSTKALLICSLLLLANCTTYMAATNDGAVSEDYGQRTMGTIVEDNTIESKAQININRHSPTLNNANINVFSFNRIILITGQVPDLKSKQNASIIAEKVRHVRSVHNELEIMPSNSFFSSSKDSFLKTKVASNLIGAKGVDSSRIEVIVENGKVYLMGLVTQEEASRTVESVKEVSGIKAIIKVFEYISNG
ncbi:MAG: BON domain-containing protein [Pseudomonadales bacterium]|nr:BON domain-containing protein [Pseudomonadales bacterium]